MATIDWKSGVSGDWADANKWDGGVAPTGADDAVVGAPGAYTVSIVEAQAANSLMLNGASATVQDGAALTLGSALTVSGGAFVLTSGGAIDGGVLSAPGGSFVWNGGTLSGVSYRGTFSVGNDQRVTVTDGFTVTGANGTGPGLIKLLGNSTLGVAGGETLDNATLEMGGGLAADVGIFDPTSDPSAVVLGPNLSVVHTGENAGFVDYSMNTNLILANEGTITADAASGEMTVYLAGFVNAGKIDVGGTDDFFSHPINFDNAAGGSITVSGQGADAEIVNNGGTWHNEGTISIQDGARAEIGTAWYNSNSWTNSGTITVGSGATAYLEGDFNTDTLDSIVNNGGTLAIDGILDNSGSTLQVGSGTSLPSLELDSYQAVISGGTIQDEGQGLVFQGGTLANVTYEGVLNLSAGGNVQISQGIDLTTVSGSGDGEIDLTGPATLTLEDSETLDHATLNIGGASTSILYVESYGVTSGTVTLGADFRVVQAGAKAEIYGFYNYDPAPDLVLDGSLTAGVAGGDFIVEVGKFTNNGQVEVSGGDNLNAFGYAFDNAAGGTISIDGTGSVADLSGEAAFDNAGAIAVGSGARTVIAAYETGAFVNSGSISIAKGGVLVLEVRGASSSVQGISNSGLLIDESGLDNSGAVFTVGSGGLGAVELQGGSISGGTVVDTKGDLSFYGGLLSSLTYEGVLSLANGGAAVVLGAGVGFAGAGGTGKGLIELTGDGAIGYVAGGSTLDDAVLEIGSADTASTLEIEDLGGGRTVTLGSGLQVVQTGALAKFAPNARAVGSTLVNDGSITAAFAGGVLNIQETRFTNDGSLLAGNGETVAFGATILTNFKGGTLTGGIFEADAGSTIELRAKETIVTDDATLVLNGAGSAIQSPGADDTSQVRLEQTLARVGTDGVLEVLGERDWSSTRTLRNAGTLDLGGGAFDTAGVTNTGAIHGFGTLGSALVNTGTVDASGGMLEIEGRAAGAGVMDVEAKATLQFDALVNAGVMVGFTAAKGVLALKDAADFRGRITGLASNTVDLLSTQATAATLEGGGRLVVTDNGAVVATLRLTDSYAGERFRLVSDGDGGTDITVKAASLVQASAAFGASASTVALPTFSAAAAAAPALAAPLLRARG